MAARRRALAAVAAVAAVLAIGAQLSGALSRVEAWTVDVRFALRGAEPARDVAVVAIGDADITAFQRWPMRRTTRPAANGLPRFSPAIPRLECRRWL